MEDYSHYKVEVVPDEQRLTTNTATLYEEAALIAVRAKILEVNPTIFIKDGLMIKTDKVGDDVISVSTGNYVTLTNAADIATKELNEKRCPLSVKRVIAIDEANKTIYVEIISANDLTMPILPYFNH